MIACQSTLRDRDTDGIVRKDGGCIEGNRFRREDVRNRILVQPGDGHPWLDCESRRGHVCCRDNDVCGGRRLACLSRETAYSLEERETDEDDEGDACHGRRRAAGGGDVRLDLRGSYRNGAFLLVRGLPLGRKERHAVCGVAKRSCLRKARMVPITAQAPRKRSSVEVGPVLPATVPPVTGVGVGNALAESGEVDVVGSPMLTATSWLNSVSCPLSFTP